MRLARKYENVYSFTLVDERILCIRNYKSNIIRVINEFDLNEITVFEIESLSGDKVFILGNKIYYTTREDDNKMFNYALHVDEFGLNGLINGGYYLGFANVLQVNKLGDVLSINTSTKEFTIQYIDIQREKVNWIRNHDNYAPRLFDEKYYFSASIGKMPYLRLIENRADLDVWVFNTEEIASQIQNTELGFLNWTYVDEKLISYFKSGEILLLALNSGEYIDVKSNDNRFGNYGYYVLDRNKKQLIKIFKDTYHVYKIDIDEFEFYSLSDLILPDDENTSLFVHDDEFIYYISNTRENVVSFNKTTRFVEWKYSLNNVGSSNQVSNLFNSLELLNNKLYVMDNKKNLYVFEK